MSHQTFQVTVEVSDELVESVKSNFKELFGRGISERELNDFIVHSDGECWMVDGDEDMLYDSLEEYFGII